MVLNGVKWCRIGNCIHYVALFQEVLYVETIQVYNIQNEMCYLLSSASLIIKFWDLLKYFKIKIIIIIYIHLDIVLWFFSKFLITSPPQIIPKSISITVHILIYSKFLTDLFTNSSSANSTVLDSLHQIYYYLLNLRQKWNIFCRSFFCKRKTSRHLLWGGHDKK